MDFLQWWQCTDYAALATVIGMGITAEYSSVLTDSIEGAEINLAC